MPTFRQRLKSAIAAFSAKPAPVRYPQPVSMRQMREAGMKRSYSGAQVDRLTLDWQSPLTTGDAEMRTRLRTLRGRARELERNDPYTKRFLSRLQDNVYDHHGITFSSLAGEWRRDPKTKKLAYILDEMDAAVIEQAYTEWKKNPFARWLIPRMSSGVRCNSWRATCATTSATKSSAWPTKATEDVFSPRSAWAYKWTAT